MISARMGHSTTEEDDMSEPDLNKKGWQDARAWAVAFKCDRCDFVDFGFYQGEQQALRLQRPLEGWSVHGYGLLCPKCTESYRTWLKEGRNE